MASDSRSGPAPVSSQVMSSGDRPAYYYWRVLVRGELYADGIAWSQAVAWARADGIALAWYLAEWTKGDPG
jgi:hypothetical protein